MTSAFETDFLERDLGERPRDVVLTSPHATSHPRLMILIGTVLGAIAAFMFLSNEAGFELFFAAILAIFAAGLLFAGIRALMVHLRLSAPGVTISVAPLCVGESFTGRFEQLVKSVVAVQSVTVTLVCREQATYRRGTDTTTVTKDVYTEERRIVDAFTANLMTPITGEFQFQLPKDAMHSFDYPHNKIQWLLKTHTAVVRWPDDQRELLLTVIPRRVVDAKSAS